MLAFAGASALAIALAMGPFRRRLEELYACEGERQACLVENIRAMPTVKSLSLEPLRRAGWDSRTAVATGMRFRVGRMGIGINAFMQLMQKGMVLGTLWWGVYLVFDNVMTVGALVAFNMYAQRVSGPLVQFAGLIQQWQETAVSMKMLGTIMDEPPEDEGRSAAMPVVYGALRGEGISFRYAEDAPLALENVSFAIPAGGTLGIVGRSGSGKSTLTRLIQRLIPMQEGHIRLDGTDLQSMDMHHLRQSMGVVLQENFLFRGRVRDNIAMTRPTATLEEIVWAARMAAAHDFIEKLPEGYNTVLEEGGSNLSGGQRQRLAIARALLTDPKIMIFDEATSALDPESEAEIQDNMRRIAAGRTMIIVSHRLSMLRHADSILVLENSLVGSGSHEELYAHCPQYRQLWDVQNRVAHGGRG
ncbi:MAG: peptidase domain-containing ABC transporter [Desulfovibrio sp.]|nr:peptidase domain-containing ABC transporter [Desulfovibrio sp.]